MPELTRRKVVIGGGAALAASSLTILNIKHAQASPALDHRVDISGFEFSPSELTVKVRDTITWVNRDIAPHTATADDDSWDTGTLNTNEEVTLLVTAAMITEYYCRHHPMMKATITIESATI
jgi:plastocyanin